MTTYTLSGLHCGACVRRVTEALKPLAEQVDVTLNPMQASIIGPKVDFSALALAVSGAGKYELHAEAKMPTGESFWITYRPLLLIVSFILLGSLLVQIGHPTDAGLSWHETMRYFMAGFFLVFAFFKLLDINAFANAYAGYDLLAKRWFNWGRIYPFIELALGAAYLANVYPLITNVTTLIVMSFSAIGVIQAVGGRQKIQCACLGTVFKLPMSTVTIVEDVGMALMAALMLLV